jgi:hypothetical protein
MLCSSQFVGQGHWFPAMGFAMWPCEVTVVHGFRP